jgi:hypothetical protein
MQCHSVTPREQFDEPLGRLLDFGAKHDRGTAQAYNALLEQTGYLLLLHAARHGSGDTVQGPDKSFACRFTDPGYQACVVSTLRLLGAQGHMGLLYKIKAAFYVLSLHWAMFPVTARGSKQLDWFIQDATRKSLVTATAASSLLGCAIMGELLSQRSMLVLCCASLRRCSFSAPLCTASAHLCCEKTIPHRCVQYLI